MISFRSELTLKLLNYFFINSDESLYANEMVRKLNLDKRNLAKKLKELEKVGILRSQRQGNLKLYSIDRKYPLYKEYRAIILKTAGFEVKLKAIIEKVEGISRIIIYGSYARNKISTHSDIDLVVVGSHDIVSLQRKLNQLQKDIGREINVVNISPKEWQKRVSGKEPFITGILHKKNIQIKR